MEAQQKKLIGDFIIDGLRKAATDLEKFRLQAALGKAEARDLYERSRKKFGRYVQEARLQLDSAKKTVKAKTGSLRAALEALQVQLALGKAESKELFEKQRKEILRALKQVEIAMQKNKASGEFYSRLHMEIEKFKIKLDIMKLRYELNKLNVRDEFEDKKLDFSKRLHAIRQRLLHTDSKTEKKWGRFRKEISAAYGHMKKAFAV
ncbi:MAG: hypothetical protein AB1458_14805 [Bacteroidota bacterium]